MILDLGVICELYQKYNRRYTFLTEPSPSRWFHLDQPPDFQN